MSQLAPDLRRSALAVFVTLSAVLLSTGARAQTTLDPRVNMMVQQDGRLLDANPQLYGSRYNVPMRPMPPLLGNAQATGLAGHGFSLRSSRIPYVGEFRGALGSAALSDFRRDSVTVLSAPLGTAPLDQLYYDPARTAPTAGMLRYGNQPSGGALGITARVATDSSQQTPLANNIIGMLPQRSDRQSSPVPAMPAPITPVSSIFGVPPAEPPRVVLPPSPSPWLTPDPAADEAAIPDWRAAGTSPLDLRVPNTSELIDNPLSSVFRSELYPTFGRREQPDTSLPGWRIPGREPQAVELPKPTVIDPSMLPGFDVFTDMQLAVSLLADPGAAWFQEMQAVLERDPQLASQVDAEIARNSADFVKQALEAPLRTFAGPGASAVNDFLIRAEANMEIRQYAEAEDRYRQARFADPRNPLPVIGLAHALLAQGSYSSAAAALEQAIGLAEMTPGLAGSLFRRLDLMKLLGGGEIVDIRRADLMAELDRKERPELRFLLGYLEYHTGDRERGKANLERAAEHPLASRIIVQYPRLLTSVPGTSAPQRPEGDSGTAPEVLYTPAEELVVPPTP